MKPPIACSHRGCSILAKANNGGLCDKHQKERHKRYDQTRTDGKLTKVYSTKAWKLARKAALARDLGWCVRCKAKPANVVDHIKELSDGGCAYCLDNLQCLCNSCHTSKTAEVAASRKF
jgi:5-methylcytosine-specific restriction endonuclease McrA